MQNYKNARTVIAVDCVIVITIIIIIFVAAVVIVITIITVAVHQNNRLTLFITLTHHIRTCLVFPCRVEEQADYNRSVEARQTADLLSSNP